MSKLRPTTTADARPDVAGAVDLALAGARVHVDVTIPRTTVRGRMRLISRGEKFAATAEVRRELAAAGFPVDGTAFSSLGASDQYQYELAAHVLAIAVRDPANTDRALAPLDDWRACDDDQIAALWREYQDLEARLDPIGSELVALTEAEQAAFVAAAKKKDAETLISFGSRKLARFVTFLVDLLPS